MARRRGFFAQVAHDMEVAARKREQAARAAIRAQQAAERQAEQAQRRADVAYQKAVRAATAEQKVAQKEAQRLYDEAMVADVEARNAALVATYEEIDNILAATLGVDDWVDLNLLRSVAEYPPFPHPELEAPTPAPPPIATPAEPPYLPPPAPSGMFGKKRHAEALARAQASYASAHQAWQAHMAGVAEELRRREAWWRAAEESRLARLEAERAAYRAECQRLDAEAAQANKDLEELMAGVAYGTEDAVQEYVEIVLSNSVYPDTFPVVYDHRFNSQLRELDLTVLIPAPDQLPSVKDYKYVRTKREIITTQLPRSQQKERYTSAVHQVALRSLHEVFEADRAGWVQSISLTVAVESIDRATGHPKRTALVAVPAARGTFAGVELANIVPLATLQHLGALVSKNPFDLVPIDDPQGVRRR